MSKKLVSVVIPTYNRGMLIERSVRSVLDQSYPNLELIVADDGSTDNTEAVVRGIGDERLRYIKIEKNGGACAARNRGIAAARGEFIAFQDSDDLWDPNKLEEQTRIQAQTGADIVFCQMRAGGASATPALDASGFIPPGKLMTGIGTQSLLIKKVVLDAVPFDERMPRFQDLEWLFRAVRSFSLYGQKKALVEWHIQPDSLSFSLEKLLSAAQLLYEKYPDLKEEYPVACEEIVGILATEAKRHIREREVSDRLLRWASLYSTGAKGQVKRLLCKARLIRPLYLLKARIDGTEIL